MSLSAHVFHRLEVKRVAVHAISQAGRSRAIRKNMPEMPVAGGAADFRSAHPEGAILELAHGIRPDGLEETRPAASGIEFRIRDEERILACCTAVKSWTLLMKMRTRAGTLRAVLAQDLVLFGREPVAPFGIGSVELHQ
jgi:hypothetical protein